MGDERMTDARLHEYFDGELSPEEASEVRRRVAADPALRAKLEGLAEVRAVVRAQVASEVADVPSDDLWARIEAGIAKDGAAGGALEREARSDTGADPRTEPAKPGLRVIAGGAEAARGEPGRSSAPSTADSNRRGRVIGVVIAGLALAAAVLLLVIRPGEPSPDAPEQMAGRDEGQPDEHGSEGGDERLAVAETAEDAVFRTEVIEVDFGSNSGAVFAVEGEDGEHYAVVWLADVQPKRTSAEQ